jgi:hypothetical protein
MTDKKVYKCPECGLHYEDEATMMKCDAFCKENSACNLEITKFSVESREMKDRTT